MTIDIVDFPIKMVIFHSYVSLPEGNNGVNNGEHMTLWLA